MKTTTYNALLHRYNANALDVEKGGDALQALARAVAYSVLHKVIDPCAKTGNAVHTANTKKKGTDKKPETDTARQALIDLKTGLASDAAHLDAVVRAGNAWRIGHDANGDAVSICTDEDAAAVTVIGETLSDGVDLYQEAACAILEETAKQAGRQIKEMSNFYGYDIPNNLDVARYYETSAHGMMHNSCTCVSWIDLERPYTVRRLKRKTLIRDADSAAWEDVQTTPIREVYRAVRNAVKNSRAMQVDPRNGYSYIEDIVTDTESDALETVYIRLGKYADLGGYVVNANGAETHYTTDRQSLVDYDATLEALNLSDRQASIIRLRMRGYGYRAIASYLGVTPQAVNNCMLKVQAKAEKIGFTPSMWGEMCAKN